MGGMETRTITLRNLDTFSHIGVFSGGSIAVTNITDMAAFKAKNKLVFVSYGSKELGGEPRRRSQGEHRSAQGGRHQQPLLRFARHGPRMAVLAAQPARVCPAAVQSD
jgi:hypothetical protein